jgi:hypothetical protein
MSNTAHEKQTDARELAARRHLTSPATWVVPKAAVVGDDVVVYVGRFGFFATARIASAPVPREGWPIGTVPRSERSNSSNRRASALLATTFNR